MCMSKLPRNALTTLPSARLLGPFTRHLAAISRWEEGWGQAGLPVCRCLDPSRETATVDGYWRDDVPAQRCGSIVVTCLRRCL